MSDIPNLQGYRRNYGNTEKFCIRELYEGDWKGSFDSHLTKEKFESAALEILLGSYHENFVTESEFLREIRNTVSVSDIDCLHRSLRACGFRIFSISNKKTNRHVATVITL